MQTEELNSLLSDLTAYPAETQWIEFKMGKGSITNEQIGEYISAMSNGATISNQPFGYILAATKLTCEIFQIISGRSITLSMIGVPG